MKKDSWAEVGSFKTYFTGYFLSILLTLAIYFSVVRPIFSKTGLMFIIIGLAFVQMVVQFLFFFHLGKEAKPRWNVMVFLFMLLIVVLVIVGSLWIMSNLDYRMMPTMGMHD